MVLAAPSACCLTSSGRVRIEPACDSIRPPKFNRRRVPFLTCSSVCQSSLACEEDDESASRSGSKGVLERVNDHLTKAAFATVVAGLVIFGPTGDALAAKSGGRVGGQAFRSAPPPRAAPKIDNSRRANVFINPPSLVAPPVYGGYGGPFFGGWGWSPFSFFAPGPSIAIGIGSSFEIFSFLLFIAFVGRIINFLRRRRDDDYYD